MEAVFRHDKVASRRSEKGLTQEELASITGAGLSTVITWEKDRVPSAVFLLKLSDALDVEPEYFFDISERKRTLPQKEVSTERSEKIKFISENLFELPESKVNLVYKMVYNFIK